MSKLKLSCALLALIIALWSATAVIAVKINLAVALACITMVVALISSLTHAAGSGDELGPRSV